MRHRRIVIVAGGDCQDPAFHRSRIREGDYIICADGGAAHIMAMGLQPDLVVGDLDSLEPALRRQLEETAASFLVHPPEQEKAKSDLEMALDRAVALRPVEILILGALGGERADHAYANLVLLYIPLLAGIPARIVDERHEIRLVDREIMLTGNPGDYLSLFPLTDAATGVVTGGLKYPLYGETLHFGSTRGLSNELTASSARISLNGGLLLVIHGVRPLNI